MSVRIVSEFRDLNIASSKAIFGALFLYHRTRRTAGKGKQYANISPTPVPTHWKHDSHHLQVTGFYRFLFLYEARGCNTISQQVLMSYKRNLVVYTHTQTEKIYDSSNERRLTERGRNGKEVIVLLSALAIDSKK